MLWPLSRTVRKFRALSPTPESIFRRRNSAILWYHSARSWTVISVDSDRPIRPIGSRSRSHGSGAEIEALCREAAMVAFREVARSVPTDHVEEAVASTTIRSEHFEEALAITDAEREDQT
ncbi:hypothetical protein OB905_08880 [Halobacteria archaeon AArc-dxtr1]|nr:hypothetical protein [Halobacteria archaeon AArc-dxtr1]